MEVYSVEHTQPDNTHKNSPPTSLDPDVDIKRPGIDEIVINEDETQEVTQTSEPNLDQEVLLKHLNGPENQESPGVLPAAEADKRGAELLSANENVNDKNPALLTVLLTTPSSNLDRNYPVIFPAAPARQPPPVGMSSANGSNVILISDSEDKPQGAKTVTENGRRNPPASPQPTRTTKLATKTMQELCYQSPYCLYADMGLELDNTTCAVLIGFFNRRSGVSVVRRLNTLRINQPGKGTQTTQTITKHTANAAADLLLDLLKAAKLPLENLKVFYCTIPDPEVNGRIVAKLRDLCPHLVSLGALACVVGDACQMGLMEYYGQVVELVNDIHFFALPDCLKDSGYNVKLPITSQYVAIIAVIQNMSSNWVNVEEYFRDLRPDAESGRLQRIRCRMEEPRVRLDFVFLSQALGTFRSFQDLQHSMARDMVVELHAAALLVNVCASSIFTPSAAEEFVRKRDLGMLRSEKDLLPVESINVGLRAGRYLGSLSYDVLGKEDRVGFLLTAQRFYQTVLQILIDGLPGMLSPLSMRNIGTLLKHPCSLKWREVPDEQLAELASQLGVCQSSTSQLTSEYVDYVQKTKELSRFEAKTPGLRWQKVLKSLDPSPVLYKLVLTLLAFPRSLQLKHIFQSSGRSASPPPPRRVQRKGVKRRYRAHRAERQQDSSSSSSPSDEDHRRPRSFIPGQRRRKDSEDSDYTDNSSDLVDVTEECRLTTRQNETEAHEVPNGTAPKLHKLPGEIQMEIHKPVGEIQMEIHKPVGEIQMEIHKPVGEIQMEIDKPVEEIQMEIHKPAGEIQMPAGEIQMPVREIQMPVREIQTEIHKPAGEIQMELHKPIGEIQMPVREIQMQIHKPIWVIQMPVREIQMQIQKPAREIQMQIQKPAREIQMQIQKPVGKIQKSARQIQKPVRQIQKSVRKIQKSASEIQKPVRQIQKPVRQIQKPVRQIQKPVRQIQKPVRQIQEPVREIQKHVGEIQMQIQNPVCEIQKPVSEIQKPVSEIQKPDREIQKPDREIQKPDREIQRPDREIQKPDREIQKPDREIQKPDREIQKPDREIQKPDREIQKPVCEVENLVIESVFTLEGDEDKSKHKAPKAEPTNPKPEQRQQGELVLIQLEHSFCWPAVTVPSVDDNLEPDMKNVVWYGHGMTSEVSVEYLLPFSDFSKFFSQNNFATVAVYKDAVFMALREASARCQKQFSASFDDKEEILGEMLDWAFGGFRPTGPKGFAPAVLGGENSGQASKPSNGKLNPESLPRLSVMLYKLPAKPPEKPAGADSAEKGAEKPASKASWKGRSLKKKSPLFGEEFEDADTSPDFVPHKKRPYTKADLSIKANAHNVYTQPDQKRRERIIRRIVELDFDIDDFCLCCGTEDVVIFHPLFKGSLCLECKNNFMETLHRYDEDGYQSYCTICCYGMEVILCGNESCCRSFCADCLDILVGEGTFNSLKDLDPWICYMCQSHETHGALTPRPDWSFRVQEFFANNSAMEFEPHRVYPSIPASLRRPVRVLSLFDGIATGFLVLKDLGFKVETYVASEVCGDSLAVAHVNHDGKIIHVGDARLITQEHLDLWGPFDLLIGGSPCNDLSIVNPLRKGLYEGTGRLFFEYYRILQLLKPKEDDHRPFFWLFENVVFMNTHDRLNICRFLECNPVLVDAVKVSPANRARYFWGNIPGMSRPITASQTDKLNLQDCLEIGRVAAMAKVRTITTNANSLKQGKNVSHLPVLQNGSEDTLWITEIEKIFGFPKHYTDVRNMSRQQRQKVLGKAWSVPVIRHLFAPLKDYFACEELPPLAGTSGTSGTSTSGSSPRPLSPATPETLQLR
ncbi:uncharacterized protein [Eucyclogobius newberryi]|uniref:uncharacterized protein n=1 Tax=Eucyclogobius newberryi TaxID=166745 RepID=UPI003B5C24FD